MRRPIRSSGWAGSSTPVTADATAARRALDDALATPGHVDATALRDLPAGVLDQTLRDFADAHGAAALPVLEALTAERVAKAPRRAARVAIYRLAQRGIQPPPRPAAKPVVERRPERALRAWVSGVDGTGSRAAWVLFDGAYGGQALCSLIVNDVAGILDAAGGEITKKRLESELTSLRATQKLPWVEVEPERALAVIGEALALHRAAGTSPPPAFARWERLFTAHEPEPLAALTADPGLAERAVALLELPELAGWFVDPEAAQPDALDLLQLRESQLVVSDQIKAERQEAILTRVIEREVAGVARERWARRLAVMAFIFAATERPEPAALAEAAAAALLDPSREPHHQPFVRALAQRGLDVAMEVATGRVSAADVSRKPGAGNI
jgi:hypothetical protein